MAEEQAVVGRTNLMYKGTEAQKKWARENMRKWRASHPHYKEDLKRWRAANPDRVIENARRRNAKRVFGISLEEYDAKIRESGGICAICGKSCRVFLDHNHKTKQLRGCLCSHCNFGLGQFKDDRALLLSALRYLRKWK